MGMKLNAKEFGFTSYANEPASDKLDFVVFNRLNKKLNLQNFGNGIEHILFAFIALDAKFFRQEQYIKYYPKQKEVHLSLELDYEQFATANSETALEMMKQLYLSGLRALLLFQIQDFDVEELIEAVEMVLAE